jgi:glycosyltransferase involved in cell wall biosynthesis
MAAGCPVIGTAVTSHPEVVGDAGMLVPLEGAAEHAAVALRRVLDEPGLADALRSRGRAQAATFSWDAVADRTIGAWNAMLESSSRCDPRSDSAAFAAT